MNINLKHIFKSDLDPNSAAWWSVDKIDKINYNFGLLTLGGSEGPLGKPGSNGVVGDPGSEGFEGDLGFDGSQGAYGISGAEPWKKIKNPEVDNSVLIPKFNDPAEEEVDVTRVIFGEYISNYIDTDGDNVMDSGDTLITENSPVDFHDAILGIYTHDFNFDNLEFRISGSENKAGIDLRSDGINDTLEIYSTQINFKGGRLLFNDYEKVVNWLKIDELEFKPSVGVSTKFNSSLTSTGSVKYQNNPATGYILAANNATGQVAWRDKLDVFEGLPIGSVVSIPCSYFNSSNFYVSETLSLQQSNQSTLHLRYGRGKDKFSGWYVCNGKTWTNGTNSYNVPNLSSFTYNISSNGVGQISVSDGDNRAIVIGGSKAYVTGVFDSQTAEYENNIALTNTDIEITLTQGTGGYYMSRNIHIVYLKQTNLTWSDNVVATGQERSGIGIGPGTGSNTPASPAPSGFTPSNG